MDKEGITTVSPVRFKKDLNGSLYGHVKDMQVRPRLLQSEVNSSQEFQKLSEGYKATFIRKDDENMKLPVVGYAGHRKGQKAENVYAKNFRDTAIYAETSVRKARK